MPRRERRAASSTAQYRDLAQETLASVFESSLADLKDPGGTNAERKERLHYQKNPVDYFVDKLGCNRNTLIWSNFPQYANHQWDGDPDPLIKILDALVANKDVAVESATGTGKTRLGGMIGMWFLDVFRPSIVVTTAPKEAQLTLHIWKEISLLFDRSEE